MKLRKVKSEAEARVAMAFPTPGRDRVEFTIKDGVFTALRLGQLHVGFGQYGSSLDLSAEQEFDTQSLHRVTATVKGFPPSVTYFDDWSDAAAKRDSFDSNVEVVLSSDRVEVFVDELGAVVREVAADPAAPPAAKPDGNDLPF